MALAEAALREGMELPLPIPEAADNQAFMAGLRAEEASMRTKDISAKRLLSSPETINRLAVFRQALSAAVRAQRIFPQRGKTNRGALLG